MRKNHSVIFTNDLDSWYLVLNPNKSKKRGKGNWKKETKERERERRENEERGQGRAKLPAFNNSVRMMQDVSNPEGENFHNSNEWLSR